MIDIIKIRRDLHQIPETGFKEYKTQKYILNIINKYCCEIFVVKTGIIAFFNNSQKDTIVYRCDMDGLPIKEKTSLSFSSTNDSMHACGHDAHMALGIGLCDYLDNHYKEYQHNYAILFQPSEEIYGGSDAILHSKILQQIDTKYILAIHLFPKLEKGKFFTSKTIFGSARELNINIYGKNCHVGNKKNQPDALLVGTKLVDTLSKLSNRKTLVHIGQINSGDTRNSVASYFSLKGTIRSKSNDSCTIKKIESILNKNKKKYQLKIICDTSSFLPKITNNSQLIKQASKLIDLTILNKTYFQGEDFSLYSLKYPCLYLLYGIGETPYLHSQDFSFDDKILIPCLHQLIKLINLH